MKYFTKEWYELCQKVSYHLDVEEDEKAGDFSEAYFQEVYEKELANFLDLRKELDPNFEENEAREEFEQILLINQEILKSGLPDQILNQIADLRVFALNRATKEVLQAVTEFCEENNRTVQAVSENYNKYYDEASISFDKEIAENFWFHDCIVSETIQHGTSFTLVLDHSGGFTNIEEVIFENFEIIKQDAPLENGWWLYEEVYKIGDRYEFHGLLDHPDAGLIDFIIAADRVVFSR